MAASRRTNSAAVCNLPLHGQEGVTPWVDSLLEQYPIFPTDHVEPRFREQLGRGPERLTLRLRVPGRTHVDRPLQEPPFKTSGDLLHVGVAYNELKLSSLVHFQDHAKTVDVIPQPLHPARACLQC